MNSGSYRLAGALAIWFAACSGGSDSPNELPGPSPSLGSEGAHRFERALRGSASEKANYGRWLHGHGSFGAAAKAYSVALDGLTDVAAISKIAWLKALALDQAGLDSRHALADARRLAAHLAPVWRLSSERALDLGDAATALEFAQRASVIDATDPMSRVLEARAHRTLGQLDLALARVNEALRLDPEHPAARHLRGVVALDLGRPDAALWLGGTTLRRSDVARDATYREVLEFAEGAEGALVRAEGLAASGKPETALQLLEPLARLPDASVDLLMSTAEMEFRLGRKDQAETLWRRLAAKPNPSSKVFERLATLAMDRGLHADAWDFAERALKADAGSAAALMVRGAIYLRQGKVADAIADLRNVVRLRPDWALARSLLVDALRSQARALPGGETSDDAKVILDEVESLTRSLKKQP